MPPEAEAAQSTAATTTAAAASTQQTTQAAAQQTTQQTTQTAAAPQAAQRPSYIPEALWDTTKNEVKGEDLGKILTAHQARETGKITDFAKVELKTSVKAFDGGEYTLNRDNPLVKAVGGIAVERGWTGQDLQPILDAVATAENAAAEAETNEYLKLGSGDRAKADIRANAVIERAARLLGFTGKPAADGKIDETMKVAVKKIVASFGSVEQFETLEKILNAAGGPAAASLAGGGTVTNIAERLYPDANKKAG